MNDSGGKRLWIGNLDERITEFTLLKILQKYGKIEQFDFLFHKSGPKQGKPRGYCFASYIKRTDAVHALHSLDGKLALGKKLAVKWAHSHIKAPSDPVPLEPPEINLNPEKIPGTFGGSATKVVPEEPPPKRKPYNPSVTTQIRAIEGKLREMERQTAKSTFKPIPVYAAKRPKTPDEVTEKCLPSLLEIPVEPPPTTESTATSTASNSAASSTSLSSVAAESSPEERVAEETSVTAALASSTEGSSAAPEDSSVGSTAAKPAASSEMIDSSSISEAAVNDKGSAAVAASAKSSSTSSKDEMPSSCSKSSSSSSSSSSSLLAASRAASDISISSDLDSQSKSSTISTTDPGTPASSLSSSSSSSSSSLVPINIDKSHSLQNSPALIKSLIKPGGKTKLINRPKPYDRS